MANRCRRLYAAVDVGCDRLASACLMFAAMPRRFAAVISSLSCLTACRLPLRVSARASSRFASPRLVISSLVPSHGFSLSAPPHRHDGRGDTMALRLFPRLCFCPSARHPIRAVRHRMATVGSVLASLDCPCLFPPHGHHRCRLLPARSPNPISLPSGRPTVLPPHHLIASPPRSLDTGDGAGFFVSAACLSFGSFATAV